MFGSTSQTAATWVLAALVAVPVLLGLVWLAREWGRTVVRHADDIVGYGVLTFLGVTLISAVAQPDFMVALAWGGGCAVAVMFFTIVSRIL